MSTCAVIVTCVIAMITACGGYMCVCVCVWRVMPARGFVP